MRLHFYKYEATGNDFVIFDNRKGSVRLSQEQINRICDRRFGIGADGLMMLESHPELDFNLVYYNADGSESLCGNGTRAAVRMASSLGMINGHAKFNAFDGGHEAEILGQGTIRVRMNDVTDPKRIGNDWFINTGSPHLIKVVNDLKDYPVFAEGREIRNRPDFAPGGTNVNFIELLSDNTLFVRTYERGVENETLSCGTGVTAAALAAYSMGYKSPVKINTLGGNLTVEFKASQSDSNPVQFKDIFLAGPAKMVFQGELEL
jgi:diaminopimelate epimerase